MRKQSAGILAYRKTNSGLEFLLVHPGGPFFAKQDAGAWSIPKGEIMDEEPLAAARREFAEETGFTASGDFLPLTPCRLKSGKIVHAWAVEQDLDADAVQSNMFEMEWPPFSRKKQSFPEIDRAEWFDLKTGLEKINPGQAGFLRELAEKLKLK